jgi:hypothetical protein
LRISTTMAAMTAKTQTYASSPPQTMGLSCAASSIARMRDRVLCIPPGGEASAGREGVLDTSADARMSIAAPRPSRMRFRARLPPSKRSVHPLKAALHIPYGASTGIQRNGLVHSTMQSQWNGLYWLVSTRACGAGKVRRNVVRKGIEQPARPSLQP